VLVAASSARSPLARPPAPSPPKMADQLDLDYSDLEQQSVPSPLPPLSPPHRLPLSCTFAHLVLLAPRLAHARQGYQSRVQSTD